MVIWLIGLSGSGKTTIGEQMVRVWKAHAPNTVLVDGDQIRRLFRHDRGTEPYTVAGRRLNAERITELCTWLDGQGINVVCCILSLFPEMRAANRTRFSRYFEAYVNTPLSVLKKRDPRGLYAAAARGEMNNVVGIDIQFPEPTMADLVFDNSTDGLDVPAAARRILTAAGALETS